jgi:UDP-glucose 4-epimerase
MRSVVVVGGSGFVGLHTVRLLGARGYSIWATHSPGQIPSAIPNVTWGGIDLRSSAISHNWPGRCDAVIYLAQSRRWRQFPEAADDVVAVNLAALQQTASYAHAAGARILVTASTGSVYTNQSKVANENDAIDCAAPRSFYAASKLAAEILLGPYSKFLTIVQLRIFMPYGSGMGPDMLFPQLVKRVQTGQPISLHRPDGMRINPIAVSDVAEAFVRCLNLDRSDVLNLAGPEEYSLQSVGEAIGKVLGVTPRFEHLQSGEAPVIVGNLDRLCQTLDWKPSIRLEDGLRAWLGASTKSAAA